MAMRASRDDWSDAVFGGMAAPAQTLLHVGLRSRWARAVPSALRSPGSSRLDAGRPPRWPLLLGRRLVAEKSTSSVAPAVHSARMPLDEQLARPSVSVRRTFGVDDASDRPSAAAPQAPVSARPCRRCSAHRATAFWYLEASACARPWMPTPQPRRVHHDEHRGEALVLLRPPASRSRHHSSSRRSHCRECPSCVRSSRPSTALRAPKRAISVHQELRHDEQARCPCSTFGRRRASWRAPGG